MVALEKGHTTAVQFLLSVGASPTDMDRYGNTAVHYAALRGQVRQLFNGVFLGGCYVDALCRSSLCEPQPRVPRAHVHGAQPAALTPRSLPARGAPCYPTIPDPALTAMHAHSLHRSSCWSRCWRR